MSDKPKKTLEQITQDVLNSQFGISDADLSLLYDDPSDDTTPDQVTTTTTPSDATVTEPVVEEPTATPTPPTPSVTPPEPNRQAEPVPDNRSKDLESSLSAQKEQIESLQRTLQELNKKIQAPVTKEPVRPQLQNIPDPLAEIDDQTIIEKPKETIVKMFQGLMKVVLPAAFAEYDVQVTKRQAADEFRNAHTDFEELRPIMRQIVLENPSINDDIDALPRIYEEAKNRRTQMIEAMKKELNIPTTTPQYSAPAPTTTPQLSDEDVLNKLEQRIVEKIRKRRAALAATSPTTQPVSPMTRMTTTPRENPPTEADLMLEAMLKAGNPSATFLKDVETSKK